MHAQASPARWITRDRRLCTTQSSTPRLKPWACGRGDFCPSATCPDLTRLSQGLFGGYRATLPKNTTLGTNGRLLNPLLCGQRLNSETGFDAVSLAKKPSDNFVERSHPGQPGCVTQALTGAVWSVLHHKNALPQGMCSLYRYGARWVTSIYLCCVCVLALYKRQP